MTAPLVTVIVASYNQAETIEESLLSALEQDHENVEVIAADDASSDGTAEKIAALAKRWPERLVPVLGESNVGVTENCNRALRLRRGKYVTFLAGDDLFVQGKLRAQAAWMEADAERAVCGHAVEAFDGESGQVLYRTDHTMPLHCGRGPVRLLERGGLFPGLSIMVRSDVVPPYGYDARAGVVSDYKLQIDCLLGGGAYGYVEGVYARYRVHRQSMSQRSTREEAMHRRYLEGFLTTLALVEASHPELLPSCVFGRGRFLFSEGRWRAQRGEWRAARRYYAAAMRAAPTVGPKALAGMALTVMPGPLRSACERVIGALR
jgi:glycosyltransferase involved in cell wall biosynthesis